MNAANVQRPQQRGPRRMWPVIVVWAVVSFAAAAGLLALQPVLGLSMEVLSLVMLAPAIGAGVCWLTMRKRLPSLGESVATGRFVTMIGLALLVAAIYFVAVSLYRGELPQVPAKVAGVPVVVMILAQALGALAEEIGFRGVLFDALRVRLPRFVTAIVVGLGFGVWHVQYFALPALEHAAFVLGTVTLTVTMAYVMAGSFWQRMVVCTIIHLGANLALAFTGGETVPMTVFGLALVAGCVVTVPIAVTVKRSWR